MAEKELPQSVINMAKRIHSLARQYEGLSIVKVLFVANGSGTPVLWTRPSVTPLEPRLKMDILSLEKRLGQKELQRLLQILMMEL